MTKVCYDLLYMVPVCLAATGLCESRLAGPESSLFLYGYALLILGICVLLRHGKSRIRFVIPGALLALAAGFILIRPMGEWGRLLWDHRWLWLTALIAAAGFGLGWLVARARPVRRIVGVATLTALILTMVLSWTVAKLVVDMGIFFLVITIADEIQHYWKKSGYPEPRGHLVSIAPFLLALGLAVCLIPAPEKPYDWKFATKIWETVTDVFRWAGQLFAGSEESYDAVIGFSDDGSFSAKLSGQEELVMTLAGDRSLGAQVYLRGKVMDHFDGREWTDTYTEENRDDMIDSLETICAVTSYDPDYIKDYIRRVNVKLTYEDFTTQYLFTPLKPMMQYNKIGEEGYAQQGGNLIAEETLRHGTTYTIPYYRMNQDHDAFREFLSISRIPDQKKWESTRSRYELPDAAEERNGIKDGAAVYTAYDAYLAYRDRIRRVYLPETGISAKAEDYIKKLLAGAETDYDKLSRIEQLLSEFHYTDAPGKLPEDITSPETFLDHLLFRKQEGYCSYFATAFVLLARSQGIPARYVQGFQVSTKGKTQVEVKSTMSHAWPEAYLDGVGWIGFEPTPGHKIPVSWGTMKKTSDETPAEAPDYAHRETEMPEPAVTEPVTEPESGMGVWFILLIAAGVLVVFLLIVAFIDRLVSATRFRRLDEMGQFRAICRSNLEILGWLGYRIGQGETLEEFYERANTEITGDALGFLRACELVAYAGKPMDSATLLDTMKNRDALIGCLKNTKGKWFFWYRYRMKKNLRL
ncbi:MAG: DUF3488 and transglutaminase-like domain-containing protein [Eubacterium sp.]|nr:DUF3488 and transglutaminase-like domain-containing protein [Eubacterium sp.]